MTLTKHIFILLSFLILTSQASYAGKRKGTDNEPTEIEKTFEQEAENLKQELYQFVETLNGKSKVKYLALLQGKLVVIQDLMERHGVTLQDFSPYHLGPLECAAIGGNTQIVHWLLQEKGANFTNILGTEGFLAEHLANKSGHHELATIIYDHVQKKQMQILHSRLSATLVESVEEEIWEQFVLTSEKIFSIDSPPTVYLAGLCKALELGRLEMVQHLFFRSQVDWALTPLSFGPLEYAAMSGNIDLFKFLIRNGVRFGIDANHVVIAESIAIHHKQFALADWIRKHLIAIEVLASNFYESVSSQDALRKTKNMMEWMLKENVFHAQLLNGALLLHNALQYGQFQTAEWLIHSGLIDLNKQDALGASPLSLCLGNLRSNRMEYSRLASMLISLVKIDDRSVVLAFEEDSSLLRELLNARSFDGTLKYKINKVFGEDTNLNNPQSYFGKRLIDLMSDRLPTEANFRLLSFLRRMGSVEPKVPYKLKRDVLEKLILSEDTSPDLVRSNWEKAEKILDRMYQKFPLNHNDINAEISDFKKRKDVQSITHVEWGGDVHTLVDVIDALSGLYNVHDRLNVSWDFKRVLGTLIYISKTDNDLVARLIYTLSQITKCNLSKLINLLYVCQDKILETNDIDYTKMDHRSFSEVHRELIAAFSIEDSRKLGFLTWLKDNLVHKDNPERWHESSQWVQGSFSGVFAKFPKVTVDSYHFNDGLKAKIIGPLLNYLTQNSSANDEILNGWVNIFKEGKILLAREYFAKIASGQKDLASIGEAYNNFDLGYSDLTCLSVSHVKMDYVSMLSNLGKNSADSFLKLLKEECILNSELKQWIDVFSETLESTSDFTEVASILQKS